MVICVPVIENVSIFRNLCSLLCSFVVEYYLKSCFRVNFLEIKRCILLPPLQHKHEFCKYCKYFIKIAENLENVEMHRKKKG